jgi:hypothetical protein
LLTVLPLALGAAISPTFLVLQIVVLSGGPGSLARGWALALGSMSMLALISLGGLSVLSTLPDVSTGKRSVYEGVLMVLAGVTLLGVAAWFWRRPPRENTGTSRFAGIVDAKPPVMFGIGAARLAINASTLALYIPALHAITRSAVILPVKILCFAVLFLITEAAVLAPVVAVTIMGDSARPALARIHDAIEHNERRLTIAVALLFGIALLGLGIRVLLSPGG